MLREHPGDVTLGHMADLVSQHRRDFRLGFGCDQQSDMDTDESARQSEGIDRRIIDCEELEGQATGGRCSEQGLRELIQVIDQFGIVEIGRITANLSHDGFTQSALGRRRKLIARCRTQLGQIVELGGGRHRRDGKRCCQDQAQRGSRPSTGRGTEGFDHVAMIGELCLSPLRARHHRSPH